MEANALRWFLTLFVVLVTSACQADPSQGLAVEARPLCKDGEIWLTVTVQNMGSRSVRIENGVLPWEYDPVGTSFEAESAGRALSRNSAIPLIGRTGPIDLQPQQKMSGETPIGFMFPEIASLIGKQPITVRWAYWTEPQ